MTGFDFVVTGILLVSMLLGLWRGLIYEVMALLGWPLAFVLSRLFVDDLVETLPSMVGISEPSMVEDISLAAASYVLAFVAVLIAWAMLTRFLSKLMKAAGGGWTDRIWGSIFGMLRGSMVVMVLVWLFGLTSLPDYPLWREAMLSKHLVSAAQMTKTWLPDVIAQHISYEIRG